MNAPRAFFGPLAVAALIAGCGRSTPMPVPAKKAAPPKPAVARQTPAVRPKTESKTPATVPQPRSDPKTRAKAGPPVPQPPRFGMNLSAVCDWSREWPFIDAMKPSRPWIEHGLGPFAYDEQGNPKLKPGQSVETLLFREVDGHYPAGDYVAAWHGTGDVEITKFDVERVIEKKPGRIVFRVKPGDGGILVLVTASDPADPVRRLRVWLPGFENNPLPFHPLYLERLKRFETLRFMDWQQTNNSPLKSWSDRPRVTNVRYSSDRGVPIEVTIDLANARRANPWFCIPHRADDDFVRQFARLVRDRLDPDLKPHVEYSNEVWNFGFGQSGYAQEQGRHLRLGSPDNLRFYSQRSVEIFRIWEQEFGGKDRLVRILAAQFVNPWTSEQVLTWKSAYKNADALAVAPYFGHGFGDPKSASRTAAMTVEQLLDAVENEIDGPHRERVRAQSALAHKYGLNLIAYEGGQHLAGFGGVENDEGLTRLFHEANRHPRMHDLYAKHLSNWFAEGGGLYGVFSFVAAPSKWGSWGVLEYQDQPEEEAPKWKAILEVYRYPGTATIR